MSPDTTDPAPRRGVLKDVHALHFPRETRAAAADFDLGVGREGYDRHAGVRVPRRPALWLPGEKEPQAAPFDKGDGDDEA